MYPLAIGPIHPALKEPAMFEFEISGERIVNVDINMGHNHRGIEWMARKRNAVQIVYLAERICGICNICHALTFSRAVEDAIGITVPERAEYIRAIMGELERIHSHLLWAGVAAHEIGFDSVLYLTMRAREKIMDLIEYLTGNRVTKSIMMIGGVRRDVKKDQHQKIFEALNYYKEIYEKLGEILLEDPTIKTRTKNTGILSKEDALKLVAVGPTARASGVKKDVRQDMAYMAYGDVDFSLVSPDLLTGEVNGDVYDRIIVRLLEIRQSIELIEKFVDEIPSGDLMAEPKIPVLLSQIKKAEGEGIGRHEAARGEVFHYVKLASGNESPETWKVRAPTYSNLLSWVPMLLGEQIADIPIVAASTDPCISCTERVTITKTGRSKTQSLTREELRRLSIEKTNKIRKKQ